MDAGTDRIVADESEIIVSRQFEWHAHAAEDWPAVIANNAISYGDLDRRSNQIAHLLCDLGIGRNVPVGLFLNRSIDFVAGALGVLKAGGAYVPLDVSYPSNRLALLLNDAEAPVVLTDTSGLERIPQGGWRAVAVDSPNVTERSKQPVSPQVQPNDLAYIIFTSGSTGRPKGVEVTHANLANLVGWHRKSFGITAHDRATLHASTGFDASVWEIWPYLAAGASLYVVDDAIRTDPDALHDWMLANGITISFLPTALAEQMIQLSWPATTALRFLLTGADTLRRHPAPGLPFALVNNYGPTECTVVATSGIVPPRSNPNELPSIGRPISNTWVYIVDENLQPVQPGAPGELLIGGSGVARGYRNLPELTAERFLPDIFRDTPSARVYRTGDLVREWPDGQLAFLGRLDDQIKLRGHRIEPQEITTVLDRYPGIQASFIMARADASREKRLIAYVVASPEAHLRATDIRTFLSAHLPHYMIPAGFVLLDRFPITEHGKVDRRSLPEPTPDNTLPEDSYEEPASPLESRVAEIVKALLRVDRIGLDDNFFYLGGHSLLGAQMLARIRDAFDIDIPLLSLFDHPTIRELCAEIEWRIIAKLDGLKRDDTENELTSQPA